MREREPHDAEAFAMLVARECIANKVRLLNRAVSSIYDDALRPHGLRITQMSVLVVVSLLGDATIGDIGRILCLEKSTLSRALDRLRTRGWIDVRAAADARAVRVRITPKGSKKLHEASPAWRKVQQKARDVFGQDAVREVERVAGAFAMAAQEKRA